jgi:type 1 glutamine amidotransferase
MLRNLVCCLLPLFLFGLLTNQPASAQELKPVRIVLVVGGGGHDWKAFAATFEKLCDRTGGLKVVQRLEPDKDKKNDDSHIRKLANLKREDADVIVFFTVGYKLDPVEDRALEKFVEDGGGLVAIHCASASFGNSQAWQRLIGGRFAGHYKGLHQLDVKVTDPDHPIMKGVTAFTVTDEEYNHVFAKVERSVLAEFKARPEGSTGKNNDIVWTREVGKGRVFYSALGHGPDAWGNPAWQKMVLQSVFWAAGQPRAVTVSAKE